MAHLEPPGFLKTVLTHLSNPDHPSDRPYVTLTFAQSLDAKIAGVNGQQLILSGKESMVMTHWYVQYLISKGMEFFFYQARMRTMHDAILVGIGTALNDNPQLNGALQTPCIHHYFTQPLLFYISH